MTVTERHTPQMSEEPIFVEVPDEARVMSVTLSDLIFGSTLPGVAALATARTQPRIALQVVVHVSRSGAGLRMRAKQP